MPDSFLRQSALAHLALDGRAVDTGGSQGMAPGVAMKELPFKSIINLRGNPKDTAFLAATSKTLGFDLPLQARSLPFGWRRMNGGSSSIANQENWQAS